MATRSVAGGSNVGSPDDLERTKIDAFEMLGERPPSPLARRLRRTVNPWYFRTEAEQILDRVVFGCEIIEVVWDDSGLPVAFVVPATRYYELCMAAGYTTAPLNPMEKRP